MFLRRLSLVLSHPERQRRNLKTNMTNQNQEDVMTLAKMQERLWRTIQNMHRLDHKGEARAEIDFLTQAWQGVKKACDALQEYEKIKAPWSD